MTRFGQLRVLLALGLVISLCVLVPTSSSAPIEDDDFYLTWSRMDGPVADLKSSRTWTWGPSANSSLMMEPYAEGVNGERPVQYFDKARMEVNHSVTDVDSIWRVTTGLLATELITGRIQLGDELHEDHAPAEINVAGDPNDPDGPTYATFHGLMDDPPLPNGAAITQTVDRAGIVGDDPSLKVHGVVAAKHVPETGHAVASVFWKFMNESGVVYVDGSTKVEPIFTNPYYAVGYPLTEAYWTNVRVGGVPKLVLVQIFQRRVLTYTPDNPDGWKVEAGNVGKHYWTWRYEYVPQHDKKADPPIPDKKPDEKPKSDKSKDHCDQHSENTSNNGSVKQSNSAVVKQSGGENQTVTCKQKNTVVQGP